jgi:Asp-tRNA(Asn)/Glu-tRNA(Gln) amidotransferase A subunit family amidase
LTTLSASLDTLEARFAEREPELLAFVAEEGRFERLRHQARELTERWPEPARRPPLFGVPVGIKDIFHVEGFPTRAGSRLPPEVLAGPESAAVTALKEAGALVLGKTATTEFAYFAPAATRNPRDPRHTPGGSSSGSAAAVAAGLCPLALGTQTIGSITRPAAFCGVVGFKPTYDRISRNGVIPLSPSLDHVGLFTPGVAGAARAAAVLCRGWRTPPAETLERRPVLGIPDGPYLERASAEGQIHFHAVAAGLATAGWNVKEVPGFEDLDDIERRHRRLLAGEAARVHASWYARYGELYHPRTAELVERGRRVSEGEIEEARAGRETLRRHLEAAMDKHHIDLWISPAAPGAAPRGLESTGDPVMNLPWTQAGVPTLALPAGTSPTGLPLGLQVAGRWGEDESLLAWGEELARALGGGKEP